jgi:hypothetical protein
MSGARWCRRIFIEVGNGSVIGESPIHLEIGRITFYVQSRADHTMPITVRAAAERLDPFGDVENQGRTDEGFHRTLERF